MRKKAPAVVVLAGPNGAGKSTAAPRLLRRTLRVTEFLNADLIARGISPFQPERAAVVAGEIMLARMEDLARRRISFGLESTLAGRTLATRLRELIQTGYEFHLVYLWLPSADLAVGRVADRVRLGGHNVPEETIRRRYRAGLRNLFQLYMPLATTWRVYDNSHASGMRLIATGRGPAVRRVAVKWTWDVIKRGIAK